MEAPTASTGPRLARRDCATAFGGSSALLQSSLRTLLVAGLCLLLALGGLLGPGSARAEGAPVLQSFELSHGEDGLMLGYVLDFDLSRPVEDALLKGVPLYFVARAEVLRSRWYWRDKRIGGAERNWRLAWQPLTRRYRLSQGSLSQSYERLDDALAAIQRASRWKIADAAALEPDTRQYVEFSFRLDTSQLPRPLQIGIGGQADWSLTVERQAVVPPPDAPPALR
ncbi:DUF4390 domain-containing protein [Caldimonas sp. KR1-144]|uniref:DUF4390 domain-containing protein n=1 Tax=Caldimonas sp. KR1-144 TaxID=3400911 RepID=UPI003BFD585A